MSRRICVVTGSRAEYGLIRWVMEGIRQRDGLELQIVATGMHLSPKFGLTYQEIEKDGFQINHKVDVSIESDAPAAIAKSMGEGLIGFGEAFDLLEPDILLVLGDRYEILPAVAAALVARIPVAHVHGGEVTEGAFDDSIRHAITKMSHLHFVAADEYRRRVIQLGEDPERVFTVGGVGLDNIERLRLLGREDLEKELGFELGVRNLLVTFHPVTVDAVDSATQLGELLTALDLLEDTNLVFTKPNADPEHEILIEMIDGFVATHANSRAYTSLGQLLYLSCIRHMDGVVGNSSSGLIEAPSMATGTVNIGDRQRGRLRAVSVIDCEPDRRSIGAALRRLYSREFQATLPIVRNPYGEPGASDAIVRILSNYPLDSAIKKRFYDLTQPT